MDIACPKCAAAYELDDATIGPKGRKVRCSACGEVWRAMPAEPAKSELPAAEAVKDDGWDTEAPATIDRSTEEAALADGETRIEATGIVAAEPPATTAEPEAPTPPRGAKLIKDSGAAKKKTAAWRKIADWRVVTVGATLMTLGAGFYEREAVVRLLPQTAKLYAAAGFPVNLRGIEIRNVQSRLVVDNEESVLVVDGDLVNVSNRKVDVPRLHFSLQGTDGRQVYVWSAQPDRASLQPGETLNFRRRLAAPPAEAKNVSVRFLTRSDITAGIK